MDLPYYFQKAIERKASDLHLVEGSVPALRINGELTRFKKPPIPFGELRYSLFSALDKGIRERFNKKKDIDLSMVFFNNRFRVNIHYQKGKVGLAARLVPKKIPRAHEIGLNETIYNLTHLKDGLVLVTGSSGVGKSTTLASMLDIINAERRAHIITIEDPIEYTFEDKQSIVEQRQLGQDTHDFASALKYALRQDPNVIMVGEMRDLETITAALTAAKTGHLVLSTLHTTTASETIERIVDYFSNQNQIAHQLATVLRAVVAQQLLPGKTGGLVAAREIMVNNNAISNLIRNNQIEQIQSTIQTSAHDGMITMNKSIDNLFAAGIITEEIARHSQRDSGTKAAYY
ncbi:type IV pili twitching motility protein PilT [Candidatus Falkowbacteria bacterium]|nr:MAG: type IV pili twitching motility protein PilT [Candidatus Falkowbacteria bacterium]